MKSCSQMHRDAAASPDAKEAQDFQSVIHHSGAAGDFQVPLQARDYEFSGCHNADVSFQESQVTLDPMVHGELSGLF